MLHRVLFALAICFLSTLANAQTKFRVIVTNSSGGLCNGSITTYTYDQSTDVTVALSTCVIKVEILGGHSDNQAFQNSVPKIFLTGGPSTFLDIVLGHSLVTNDSAPTQLL
jgi:hypothetical protein